MALARRAGTKPASRGQWPKIYAFSGKLGVRTAGRRSLVVRWSENHAWIELRDPATGEWHEVRARDCLPTIVEAADANRWRGEDEGGAV